MHIVSPGVLTAASSSPGVDTGVQAAAVCCPQTSRHHARVSTPADRHDPGFIPLRKEQLKQFVSLENLLFELRRREVCAVL
jgi:hypothetical protein